MDGCKYDLLTGGEKGGIKQTRKMRALKYGCYAKVANIKKEDWIMATGVISAMVVRCEEGENK